MSHSAKAKKLARLMNRQNELPVPVTGRLSELIGQNLTPEEMNFLLSMGCEPHTLEQARKKSGLPEAQFGSFFRNLVKKGYIYRPGSKNGQETFELMPIVVGWLEMQLCHGKETDIEKRFAHGLEGFFNSLSITNTFPVRHFENFIVKRFLKPYQTIAAAKPPDAAGRIEINRDVAFTETRVSPLADAYELVERNAATNSVAVMHCFCRQWRRLLGEPCRFHIRPETCVVIGDFARYIVDYDYGRSISKKEALDILEETAKAGAVHTLYHEKDDVKLDYIAVCNCCWDCCGLYGGHNRGLLPLYFKSNFEARITDAESCKGCKKCQKHCPVNAITVTHKKAAIKSELCIGCGQCSLQCPTNSIALFQNPRNVMVPLPSKAEARIKSGKE
ncbi:MAG: 4Fe-4S binding protein [Thermodesulfobacteriota bacterium]